MKTVPMLLAAVVLLVGCTSPPPPGDYDQDTTPTEDGEHYRGGEP